MPILTALYQQAPNIVNGQQLLMNGGTDVIDLCHALAGTKTGGVGGAWTESSNFQTLLGRFAPIIAEATDNLLLEEDASFEGNTVGGWTDLINCTIAASTAQTYHGTHSLAMTATAAGNASTSLDIAAVTSASTQYTASAWFKGISGKTYIIRLTDATASSEGSVVADGTWQRVSATRTFDAGATRTLTLVASAAAASDVIYWDAIQLEQKAYATPFALDSRTATTLSWPTASLGLTPGQDISIVICCNTPWAGDDGGQHYLLDNRVDDTHNGIMVRKHDTNNLEAFVCDSAGANKCKRMAVSAANWAANSTHIIVVTRTSAGVLRLFLDGIEATVSGGAGTGLESSFHANTYIGTYYWGGLVPANAPILCAIYNRILTDGEIATLSGMGSWIPRYRMIA